MRLVFWQNCLSPHQLPYIVKLMDDNRVDSVVVATGTDVISRRKRMGWNMTNFSGLECCDVYVTPNSDIVERLLHERVEDSVHLFGGIRGDAFVYDAFKRSLKVEGMHSVDVSERPSTFAFGRAKGKPLWLHWLKWKIMDTCNMRHIERVFAMGERAVAFFRSLNSKWTVYPFGYCTESQVCTDGFTVTGCPRIVFVGSLSRRKSVGILLISTMLAIFRGGKKS